MHHPSLLPDFAGQAAQGWRMMLLKGLVKEVAKMVAQGIDRQEEFSVGRQPLALIQAQSAAGRQVMNMGMINEGAAPGVEDTEQGEGAAEVFGIGRQILQGLSAGLKQKVIPGPGLR